MTLTVMSIVDIRNDVIKQHRYANHPVKFTDYNNGGGSIFIIEKGKPLYERILDKLTWALEISDLYKDVMYIYIYNHNIFLLILLPVSITLPFILFHRDAIGIRSYGMIHSIMIYVGFAETRNEF